MNEKQQKDEGEVSEVIQGLNEEGFFNENRISSVYFT